MSWSSGIVFGGGPWYQWGKSRSVGNPATTEAAAAPSGPWTLAGGRPRLVRLAAIALAAGTFLASAAAVADSYYLRGGDGAPYRSAGEFGTVPAVELGLGYAPGAIRFEALVEYRPHYTFEGRANFLAPDRRQEVSAKLSSVSGMLAGFVDLAALRLPEPGPFAPFLGAGVGVAHTRIGKTTMTFPATTTQVPGWSRTGLAWMATAGVAGALGERVTLDLAWRYSDLGEVRTPRGPGRVVWRDGSREPLPLDLAPTTARL